MTRRSARSSSRRHPAHHVLTASCETVDHENLARDESDCGPRLQVPCDPKMLVAPLNAQQLAAFRLTTLERDPKRDLVLEPDLGIPLSVFDVDRYSVPPVPPPLAPEDQALLEARLTESCKCMHPMACETAHPL